MMERENIIIAVHSVVDSITNSSTEFFVVDTNLEVSVVESMVKEKEKEFPSEYGYHVYVNKMEEYQLKDMFGYPDEEECVQYLVALGYKVEKPESSTPNIRYIQISCERGCINPSLKNFIMSTFTVIKNDTNG